MQVFKGVANSCRDRLFKGCCAADASGAGMSNESLCGTGSRLVYDVPTDRRTERFSTKGFLPATSGGFSGSFTSDGVKVVVHGTALPGGLQ